MPTTKAIEKLQHPPLVEVICGIWFAPFAVDPLALGTYWAARRSEFPKYSLHPPVRPPGLRLDVEMPTPRTWFVSEDDAYVLQFQTDRMYVNWRKRGTEYPSFSAPGGLRSRALSEWQRFTTFCQQHIGHAPEPTGVEVSKIDQFDWRGRSDLAALIPATAPLLALAATDEPDVGFQLAEADDVSTIRVIVGSVLIEGSGSISRALRMETNVTHATSTARDVLTAPLDRANERANNVFAALIPESERRRRFGVQT